MSAEISILDRLRQPEYTGENRCVPCTILNTVIAIFLSGAITILLLLGIEAGTAPAVGAGVASFIVFVGAIYFRGYLIPGTPTITKRYFPDWFLKYFDKHETSAGTGLGGREETASPQSHESPEKQKSEEKISEVNPESLLLDAGVVEPCENRDDLCLTSEFRDSWTENVREIRENGTDKQDLAEVLGVEPDRLSFDDFGEAFVAYLDNNRVGQWSSRAALIADLGASRTIDESYPDWNKLTTEAKGNVLSGLRIFFDTCPECDGDVEIKEETVESCCRSIDVVASSCTECGARLLEVEHPG